MMGRDMGVENAGQDDNDVEDNRALAGNIGVTGFISLTIVWRYYYMPFVVA